MTVYNFFTNIIYEKKNLNLKNNIGITKVKEKVYKRTFDK